MPEQKIKIGVTGSAGSGKSLVCRAFEKLGLAVLDCDEIARDVVAAGEKGLEQLTERFGPQILLEDGALDRRQLRQLMIDDENHKKAIEQILHPLIRARLNRKIDSALYKDAKKAVAVEVPLLFESDMDDLFDVTIAVISREKQMIERIEQRDQVSAENAKRLLDLQMSQQEKAQRADYIIENMASPSQLFDLVDKLFDKIQKECLTI